MSVKRFCDCCEAELTPENTGVSTRNRLVGEYKRFGNLKPTLHFEIVTGIQPIQTPNTVWNAGDWCKYCIIDAINSLDDRPRAAGG